MNDVQLIKLIDGYAEDYSALDVLDEFFPGLSLGEIIVDAWNAGMIPTDVMEKFLTDE